MRTVAGWFLVGVGASAAVIMTLAAWITWGADRELFGFGSYTLPFAWAVVVAVGVLAVGAWLVEPPRSGAPWAVGAFIAVLSLDLLLRASGRFPIGELDGQLNEGEGTRLPIAVLALASILAFADAAWLRHVRRSAVSPQ